MVLESNQYFIHVWVKGEEHLDSNFTALEEAVKDLNTWKTIGKKYSLMDSLLLSWWITTLIKLINLIPLIKI